MPEVANAVDQARREITQRFDFKDTGTAAHAGRPSSIEVRSSTEDRLKAAVEVLKEKAVRREIIAQGAALRTGAAGREEHRPAVDQRQRRHLGREGARARQVHQGPEGQGPEPDPGRPGPRHAPRRRTTCRRSCGRSRSRTSASLCSSRTSVLPSGSRRNPTAFRSGATTRSAFPHPCIADSDPPVHLPTRRWYRVDVDRLKARAQRDRRDGERRACSSGRRARSALFERAVRSMPNGVASNFQVGDPYPVYLHRGQGSRVWDVDGTEYVDFHGGFGVNVVGHAHPKIVEAIRERRRPGDPLRRHRPRAPWPSPRRSASASSSSRCGS